MVHHPLWIGKVDPGGEPRRDAFFVPVPMSIRHLGKICAISVFGVIAPVFFGLVGAVVATTSIWCVVCFALCELHFRRWTWHLNAETRHSMFMLEEHYTSQRCCGCSHDHSQREYRALLKPGYSGCLKARMCRNPSCAVVGISRDVNSACNIARIGKWMAQVCLSMLL